MSFSLQQINSNINQPLEVSFLSKATANKTFTTNGNEISKGTRQTDRIVFNKIDTKEQGNYAFAVESSFSKTKPTPSFLSKKSFVVLKVKIDDGTPKGAVGYVKVNSESIRKRLGLDKKSFETELTTRDHDLTSLINEKIIQENEIKLVTKDLEKLKVEPQSESTIKEKYQFFQNAMKQGCGFRADRTLVLKGLIKCIELLKSPGKPLSAEQKEELEASQIELEKMHDAETLYRKGVQNITSEGNVLPIALEALNQAVDAGSIDALDELEKRKITYKGELSPAQMNHLADKKREHARIIEVALSLFFKVRNNGRDEPQAKQVKDDQDFINAKISFSEIFNKEFDQYEAMDKLNLYNQDAFKLYSKSAGKGDAIAMLKLAPFYDHSYAEYPKEDLVSQDTNKAIDFYLRGAKKIFEHASPSQVDITEARNGYYSAVGLICAKGLKWDTGNSGYGIYLTNFKTSKINGKALLQIGQQLAQRGLTESESDKRVNWRGVNLKLALGIGHIALGQHTEAFSLLTNLMEAALKEAEILMKSYRGYEVEDEKHFNHLVDNGASDPFEKNPRIEIPRQNRWNGAAGLFRLATRALDEMRKVYKECKKKDISLEAADLKKAEGLIEPFKEFAKDNLKLSDDRILDEIRLYPEHNKTQLVSLTSYIDGLIDKERDNGLNAFRF